MKNEQYIYAVARIRANEKNLLSSAEIEQLITASSVEKAIELLKIKGWSSGKTADFNIDEAVKFEQKKLWTLLNECVGDESVLHALTTENDFFNLKAAIKASLSKTDATEFFAYPTSLNLDELTKIIDSQEFEKLPAEMSECAKKAYSDACRTENGQTAAIIIDRKALECMLERAKKSGSELLFELSQYTVDCANIKTAFRSARSKKSLSFLEQSIATCSHLDRADLCKKASEGEAALLDYLAKTEYKKQAELISENSASFEKLCDDGVIERVKKAKLMFFGFEPVAAFYFAKSAEIKTVRTILQSKSVGIDEKLIRERVRGQYLK